MHHLHEWRLLLSRLLLVSLAAGQVSAASPASDANNTTTTTTTTMLTKAQQQNKHQDELMQSNAGPLSKSNRSGASNSSATSSGQKGPPQVLSEPSRVSNLSEGAAHSEWPRSANLSGPHSSGMQIDLPPPAQTQQRQYKLPSWFNFNAFKRLYGKRYGTRRSDELHRRIYLSTSLKVFEQRALYRLGRVDSLASVNELSDLTSEQLAEFRERLAKAAAPPSAQPDNNQTTMSPLKELEGPLPECCSYDQVYNGIIKLLSSAADSNDTSLSRAVVDELEQKPLLDLHSSVGDEPPTAADAELASNRVQQQQQQQTRPTSIRKHLEQSKADGSSTSPAKPARLHLNPSWNSGGPSGRRQQQASETTSSRSLPPMWQQQQQQQQHQNKQTKSSTSSELSGPWTNSTTPGSGDRPLTQMAGDGNAVARSKPAAKTTPPLAGGASEEHDAKRRPEVPGDAPDQRAAAARQHQHPEPASELLASVIGRKEATLEKADNKDRLSLGAAAPAPAPTSTLSARQQLVVGLGRAADSKAAASGKAAPRSQSWAGGSGFQSDAAITTSSLTTTTTTNKPLNDDSNRLAAARAHRHPNHLKPQPQPQSQPPRQRQAYPSSSSARRGSTATTRTTVETGEDDDEFGRSSAESSLEGGVSEELAEAVRAQVAEQLSLSSPIGRELTRQLSAYFGQPVEVRAVRPLASASPNGSGSKSAASTSKPTDGRSVRLPKRNDGQPTEGVFRAKEPPQQQQLERNTADQKKESS